MADTKLWGISDTHFGHNTLVTKNHRPEGFEYQILKNLSVVGQNDIIFHIGDVAFYRLEHWHNEFMKNCAAKKKILILGNHDKKSKSWYYDHGWDCVCDELLINSFGKKILMTHVPIPIKDFFNRTGGDKCYLADDFVNIHGHIHNTNHHNAKLCRNHFLIKLEHDYKPVLIQNLIGLGNGRK